MTRLLLVLGTELAGVGLAHLLSAPYRTQLGIEWATTASLADLLSAGLHLSAWVMTWWLLAGTVHDVAVSALDLHQRRAGRRPAGQDNLPGRTTRRIAPQWVQRVVNQAMGTLLVVGVMAGPAAAATATSAVVGAQQVVDPPAPVLPSPQPDVAVPADLDTEPDAPDPDAPQPHGAVEPVAPEPEVDVSPPGVGITGGPVGPESTATGEPVESTDEVESSHTVASGENLWVIARSVLTMQSDTPPSDREVHAYWVRLIDGNAFISGDPDLVYPGEVLTLPTLRTAGASP